MGWIRATSSDWRQYYERTDRARARLGDPFQRVIMRGVRRERLFNIVAAIVALTLAAGGIMLVLSVLERAAP